MQQAIPYSTRPPTSTTSTGGSTSLQSQLGDSSSPTNIANHVTKLVSENPVIVFGRPGCCMCHVVKKLLQGLGVNPAIFDVDEMDEAEIVDRLSKIVGGDGDHSSGQLQFPAVFVGGRLFGGIEKVMSTHISGELVPILREAGALWL